ncbi:DUF2989 domain-containing protein [Aeromonas salmonicida]|uniref:DUF2989 domain-containing protein n=1 Tax=Aeromonas salmonicida TaxID=645 RepID=UPI00259FD63F|nr:DUF2989 domain-containing protein [Aeromonas salmonicida]MDM5103087.1 DUF2989 domain-containing protein [Aeromonas salmonicida]
MTPFPLRSVLLGLSCGLTLMACNDDRIHNICANHPELCQDLVDDGWCRYERTDIIRSRFYLQEEGTDRRKYELMRNLERYLKCAERSTNIEYKTAREQKSPRVEGMLAAGDQLAELDAATRNSQDPYLLLWHWTNNTNEQAREQFMALEGQPVLKEPELQLALGGMYAKSSPQKAITLMHHALSLYGEGDKVNSRILTSLSTLYMGQKEYGLAYLWGKVSESFQDTPDVSAKRLGLYHALSKADQEAWDSQAATIVEQLKSGTYRP